MFSIKYSILAVFAALICLAGFADKGGKKGEHGMGQGQPITMEAKKPAELTQPAPAPAPAAVEDKKPAADTTLSSVSSNRDGTRSRYYSRYSRYGSGWYSRYRNSFFSPGFYWPGVSVFNTFFTDLLSNYSFPGALLQEIRQLQVMLAQHKDPELDAALRERLAKVIGELVALYPNINIQSVFSPRAMMYGNY